MTVVLGTAIMSVIGVVNGVTNLNGYISVFIWLLLAILFATAKLTSVFTPFDPSAEPLAAYNVMYTYLVFHSTIYALFLCLGWGLLYFGLKRSPGALGRWYAMFSMVIGFLLWCALHCTMILYEILSFPYGIAISFGLPLVVFAVYYFSMRYIIQHDVGVLEIAKRSLQSQATTESLAIDAFRNVFSSVDRLFWYCVIGGIFVSLTVIGQLFQYVWPTLTDFKEIYASFCTAGVLGVYVIVVWWFYPAQDCDIVVIYEPKDIEVLGGTSLSTVTKKNKKTTSNDSDNSSSSDKSDMSDSEDAKSMSSSVSSSSESESDEITKKSGSSDDNADSTTLLITRKKKEKTKKAPKKVQETSKKEEDKKKKKKKKSK